MTNIVIPQDVLAEYRSLGVCPTSILIKELPRLRVLNRIRETSYYRFLVYLQDHHDSWELNYWGDQCCGLSFSFSSKGDRLPSETSLKQLLSEDDHGCWHSSTFDANRYNYYITTRTGTKPLAIYQEFVTAYEVLHNGRHGSIKGSKAGPRGSYNLHSW